MSSLRYQRSQSNAQKRAQAGPEVSTMSFREKLQRKLRDMSMDRTTRARLRHLIQDDPVQAMREMVALKKEVEK